MSVLPDNNAAIVIVLLNNGYMAKVPSNPPGVEVAGLVLGTPPITGKAPMGKAPIILYLSISAMP